MRIKALIFGMIIVFLLSCSPKLTTENAASIIKNTFQLSDKDKIEILGISKESKISMLVKFKINDIQLNSKMRKYDKGWQLEEIQNDLGMWIPASSIANLFDQTDKVKTALTDINIIAIALTDYITDNGVVPEQAGTYDENSLFYKTLCGFYVKDLPMKDPWGHNYYVYCGKAVDGKYGIKGAADDDFLIISYGKDGQQELWVYDASNPEAGLFTDKDYDKDLINLDGSYIRGLKIEE